MGCSASRNNNLVTKSLEEEENNSSCYSSSISSSTMESTTFCSSSTSPKPPPKALSLPTPLVHHPPSRKGDSHHLVSLTSTTYGSLILIDETQTQQKPQNTSPSSSSLSPDSVINTWELMDGLDDDFDSDLDLGSSHNLISKPISKPITKSKPLWKHLSEESLLSKMDPNVASSYRRALSSRQLVGINNDDHKVQKSPTLSSSTNSTPLKTKNEIVIYFTSLRGIRKTYEDCCQVRMIFKGLRVQVDERDISMDSMYRKELQNLVGGKAVVLPQVFVKGEHIGGAEEIKQMNESGELVKVLDGFPVVGDSFVVCESCGDARFVPCSVCSGSRKVFDEIEQQLRRCCNCNENGLIRCPLCSV